VTDYHARFSVRDDFDLFEQVGLRADPTRKHYILDALNTGQQQQQQQQAKGERVKNGIEKCEPRGAAAVPMPVSSRQALYLFIYLFIYFCGLEHDGHSFAYSAHFMIFKGCLDSNPECCRSKRARYQLSHPSLYLA
jgi:hypothetical protein